MTVPYLAHVPFVAMFLAFSVCFVVVHWLTGRR
jgi:hypothetical protein